MNSPNDDLKQIGLQALKNKDFARAVEHLAQFITAAPNDFEATLALAIAQSHAGQHQAALALFGELAQVKPHSASIHFNRGVALELAQRLQDAAASYEMCLRIQPAHPKATAKLEALYARMRGVDAPPLAEVVDDQDEVVDLALVAPVTAAAPPAAPLPMAKVLPPRASHPHAEDTVRERLPPQVHGGGGSPAPVPSPSHSGPPPTPSLTGRVIMAELDPDASSPAVP